MSKGEAVPDKLWKVTIAPTGQSDPNVTPQGSLVFCREHDPQIIGVGWGLGAPEGDKDKALQLAEEKYGSVPSPVRIFVKRMSEGDHAWIYDKTDKKYYVCKIESDWRPGNGGKWDRYDIHNYRVASWHVVPKPLVPGAITRRLTLPVAAQGMDVGRAMRAYSAFLYEKQPSVTDLRTELNLSKLRAELEDWEGRRLFAALDENETEDLVGLYLQDQGWRMLKSSTNQSHPEVECQFQKIDNGSSKTSYMQVKSGRYVNLDAEEYRHFADEGATVFLFSTAKHPYLGTDSVAGVHAVPQDDIRSFAVENLELLPYPMTLKLGLMSGVIGLPA